MAYDRSSTSKRKDTGYQNDRERISQSSDVHTGYDDVSDLYNSTFVDHRSEQEKQMQQARAISFLGGLPIIGGFVRGVEQAKQVEDLYNSTGKVSAYPGLTGGYGGLGASIGGSALTGAKIAAGVNDLYQFYAGEPDAFRINMNYMYG